MWTYEQRTGKLYHDGIYIATGYAGGNEGKNPEGVNNPDMQGVHGIGPLPCGRYTMGKPITHPKLGPLAIPLTPDPANQMFGRSGFYCHGDRTAPPRSASEGCIIQARVTRTDMAVSGDTSLEVVADYPVPPPPVEGVDA